MKRRIRFRLAIIIAILVAVVWVASIRWSAFAANPLWGVGIGRGVLFIVKGETFIERGLYFERHEMPFHWKLNWRQAFPGEWSLEIPLWVPLAVVIFAAVILGRRPRVISRFSCTNCNYNLTGNVSGICPECGKEIKSVSTAIESEK